MADTPTTLRDGRYAVVRLLGEGGQASTFEAVDKKRGKPVAVKRFRVRGAKSWKEVELAEREARVLASLSHPSLPCYVDHFEEGGDLYLVTDKIEGSSLADLRRAGRSFSEAEVTRLLRDASAALEYLHGRAPPIIHRDIKPSNVMLRPDGSFSLIDFGSVRDKMKPAGGSTVVGTFGYMAPEQFQGRALPASDVYAVGTTALTLLTGVEPEDLPHKGLAVDVEAALRGSRVSREMVKALGAMLEPDPDRRASRIAPLLGGLGDPSPRRGSAQRSAPQQGPPWVRPGAAEPWAEIVGAVVAESMAGLSRRERRRAEKEQRKQQRAEGRERWREMRHQERVERRRGGFRSVPWFITLVMILGLTAAEIAVWIALGMVLPTFFWLASIFLGKSWREAGRKVSGAGEVARAAIARARDAVQGREPPAQAPAADAEGDRLRVGDPGVPVDSVAEAAAAEQQAEEEAQAAEQEARDEARRRQERR
jgi:tRNA A-37 threonylcarbamoyl transferase component Bud32